MLIEKLLKLLIDIVDADLLEAVVVKDLKAGDVEDTNVGDLLHRGVDQCFVTFIHDDPERDSQLVPFSDFSTIYQYYSTIIT